MITVLRSVAAECRKGLLISWYYKFEVVMQMITVSLIFLLVLVVAGHGKLESAALSAATLGYVVWVFAVNVITGIGSNLVAEAQSGTLEQMCMAVVPTELLLVGRCLASMITTVVMLGVFDLVLLATVQQTVPASWSGVAVLLLTLVGLFGFGLLLGGLTLVFKNVQSLSNLLVNMFVFVNGTLLSIDHFPGWLRSIANTLPSTQGVTLLRRVVTGGESLASSAVSRQLAELVLNSAVYLMLGAVIFELGARTARRRGSLGQY